MQPMPRISDEQNWFLHLPLGARPEEEGAEDLDPTPPKLLAIWEGTIGDENHTQ